MSNPVNRTSRPKGERQRRAIMEAAQAEFAENGYSNSNMSSIARRAGLSRSGLLHHFATKEDVISAILSERQTPDNDHFTRSLERGSPTIIDDATAILERNVGDRQWVAFYSGSLAEAHRAGHPSREFFSARYEVLRALLAQSIRRAMEEGAVRDDVDAKDVAAIVTAVLDGLQQQWLYSKDLDIVRAYRTFQRLLSRPSSGSHAADG